jgi:hypothetical protein
MFRKFWPPPCQTQLPSMGGWAEGLVCTDPGARTPISVSGIYILQVQEIETASWTLNVHMHYTYTSRWVKIRLHTGNHLPRLPGSALKVPVMGGGGGWSYPLSSQAPTLRSTWAVTISLCTLVLSILARACQQKRFCWPFWKLGTYRMTPDKHQTGVSKETVPKSLKIFIF